MGTIAMNARQIRFFTVRPAFGWRRFASLISLWIARHRERDLLAKLDMHMLNDIGLTRDQARQEADRPFWDGRNRSTSDF